MSRYEERSLWCWGFEGKPWHTTCLLTHLREDLGWQAPAGLDADRSSPGAILEAMIAERLLAGPSADGISQEIPARLTYQHQGVLELVAEAGWQCRGCMNDPQDDPLVGPL